MGAGRPHLLSAGKARRSRPDPNGTRGGLLSGRRGPYLCTDVFCCGERSRIMPEEGVWAVRANFPEHGHRHRPPPVETPRVLW